MYFVLMGTFVEQIVSAWYEWDFILIFRRVRRRCQRTNAPFLPQQIHLCVQHSQRQLCSYDDVYVTN